MKTLGGVGGLVSYFSRLAILPLFFLFAFTHSVFAEEGETLSPVILKKRLLGKEVSAQSSARILPSGKGIQSVLQTTFLGARIPLASFSVEANPPSQPTGFPESGRTDLYLKGIRIWSGDLRMGPNGLSYQGGVAPTQIIFPLLSYPVGPLLLRLDSGVEFEGKLNASIYPEDGGSEFLGAWGARALGEMGVAGFVEGYGTLHWVRAGLRGRVGLVEGKSGVQASFSPVGEAARADLIGSLILLRGEVRAFLDTRLLFGRWSRVLNQRLFSWPGTCFQFGVEACGAP